jgi:stearoyl-CoA desaturase (delta-9 desaturase)
MIVFHLAALLAPWAFTWTGVAIACILFFLTAPVGVGMGYHRLICHRSFQTVPWLRALLALLGVLAYQKGPLTWCGIHRLHHRHADSDLDPQMSHRGLLWAHLLWLVAEDVVLREKHDGSRVTRDLRRDLVLRCLERYFYAVNGLFALALFLLGWLTGGPRLAASLLLWAFFLRIVCGWHVTLLVNSVNHRWGYRNYPSPDQSRNCWWVALLSFGEGWHNNHHHRPRCAAHGHRWFEVDLTYALIRLLERLGLAHGVIRPPGQLKSV